MTKQVQLELKAIRANNALPTKLPSGFGVVARGSLAALVEVASDRQTRNPLQLAQRYQQALAIWWQEGAVTVLPVRAGAIFEGPQKVAAWLDENASKLEQTLTRLEDKVEMGLRLLVPSPEPIKVQSGRGLEYMQHLVQRETQMSAIEAVVSQLGSLAEEYKYEAAPAQVFSPRAAFLVSRTNLDQFVAAVNSCSTKGVLTGPVPPFSFV